MIFDHPYNDADSARLMPAPSVRVASRRSASSGVLSSAWRSHAGGNAGSVRSNRAPVLAGGASRCQGDPGLPDRRVGGRHPLDGMTVVPQVVGRAATGRRALVTRSFPAARPRRAPAVIPVPAPQVLRAGRRADRTRPSRTRRPRHRPSRRPARAPHARRRCSGLPRSPSPAAARKRSGRSGPTPNSTRCSARLMADGDVPAAPDRRRPAALEQDLPWRRSDNADLRIDLSRGRGAARPGPDVKPGPGG